MAQNLQLPNPSPKGCEQEKWKAMVDSVIEFISASRTMLYVLNERLKDSERAKEEEKKRVEDEKTKLTFYKALSVRFLTRRYLGEYDHKSETRYKHEVLVDNDPVLYEILDTCPKDYNDLPSNETINRVDGLLLVYSISDKNSFSFIKKIGALISNNDIPVYIVANKNDLVHLRDVSVEEGATLARNLECGFTEVAAAEQIAPVAVVFQELCRAVLVSRRKSKHSLLERMLGSRTSNLRLYVRGKSDSALPKD